MLVIISQIIKFIFSIENLSWVYMTFTWDSRVTQWLTRDQDSEVSHTCTGHSCVAQMCSLPPLAGHSYQSALIIFVHLSYPLILVPNNFDDYKGLNFTFIFT